MDRYVKSEPTPEAFAGLLKIPADEPVSTVSIVRLRTDLPESEVQAAMGHWRSMTRQLRREYRCEEDIVARIHATITGPPGPWDFLVVTRFPSRRVLMRYSMDERILDSIAVRRQFIAENLALVLTGSNLPRMDRLPLALMPGAADPGVGDPLDLAMRQAETLAGTDPVLLLAISRFRTDVPMEQARGAYLRWRKLLEEQVAPDLGLTFPITANISHVFVGEPGGWDLVNLVRYPNPDAYRASLRHPALLAGRHLRTLALDNSLLMIAQEIPDRSITD